MTKKSESTSDPSINEVSSFVNEKPPPKSKVNKEYESRELYESGGQSFRVPKGLSLPQRRAWKKSIDERTGVTAQIQRKLPRWAKDYVQDPIQDMKETAIEGGKAVGGALLDSALVVPRTKAAIAADPEGAKEFAGRVMSGDREAIKATATEASEGAAEPFATMGDATLGGMALQEGKYGEAALYGGLLLLPATVQTLGKSMSKGWLKSAAKAGEEIPDEAAKKMNDLAKRVDEGKVTDDMQIRREIAMIEDAHKTEYMQSKPPGGGGVEMTPELEAELMREGSYVPPGERYSLAGEPVEDFAGAPVRTPPGGGRSRFQNFDEDLRRIAIERDQFELSGRKPSGVLPDQATLDELQQLDYLMGQRDSPLSVQQINQRRTEIMEEFYANNPQLRGGKPPGGGVRPLGRPSDDFLDDPQTAKMIDYITTNPSNPEAFEYVEDLYASGKLTREQAIQEFDLVAKQKYFDDAVDTDAYPNMERPQTLYDRAKVRGGGAKALREFHLQDRPDLDLNRSPKFAVPDSGGDLVIRDLGPLTDLDRQELEFVRKKYNLSESELKELRDELGSRGYDYFVDQNRGLPPDRMPRYRAEVEDVEGPSEAEIQQMINQSRFGDPEELDMLKEDMRRMAQLEQGAQIESSRVRQSRTPGAPGASGKIPEGTSRTERKGTVRERPKKK